MPPIDRSATMDGETSRHPVATGLRSYEFPGTDEPWKLLWTDTTHELVDLRAFRPRPTGLAGRVVTSYVRPLAVRALERVRR